jgi:hypothetical protein
LIDDENAAIYGKVRCGLVHEYSIKKVNESKIVIEGGDCGIIYDKKAQKYTFHVRELQ